MISATYTYLLISLMLTLSTSHETAHHCIHDHIDFKPEILDIPDVSGPEGRMLQAYQNLRIYFDSTTLTDLSLSLQDYILNYVLPPAKNYLEAALKVLPRNGKLTAPNQITACSGLVAIPSIYRSTGVDADLAVFLTQTNEPTQSFIAYAGACYLHPTTFRPLFGRLNFNSFFVTPFAGDVQLERDITLVLHELTHVLGFSEGLMDYYINPITNAKLTGHRITKMVNGQTTKILNLSTLTSKVRAYFNCSTLEGAYLENEGGAGSAESHFERRVFYNEYMTGSAIKDTRITEFTLALLEGTGWYQVDYSFAEPMTYGKNKGCAFLESPCMANQMPSFEEFCSPLKKTGCGWTYRGAGVCGTPAITTRTDLPSSMDYWNNQTIVSDMYADNCPTYQLYAGTDCENENNQATATLKDKEYYGYGGKCFMGTLYNGGELAEPYGFCFKPICEAGQNGDYTLKVKIGTTTVTCSDEGDISVPGLGGKLQCPNPTKFCNQTLSEGFCKRKCSGRGACINKQCKCQDGWGSNDCSQKVYVKNCARCASGDPFRTSCYGDSCECNPSDNVCMCQLGLKTGSACNSDSISNPQDPSAPTTPSPNPSEGNSTSDGGNTDNPDSINHPNNSIDVNDQNNDSTLSAGLIAIIVGCCVLLIIGSFVIGLKYGRKKIITVVTIEADTSRAAPLEKPALSKQSSGQVETISTLTVIMTPQNNNNPMKKEDFSNAINRV